MSDLTIYEFEDYRQFIRHQLEANKQQRGYQSVLAKAAGCQPSFFSQAVRGQVQLTPDHAVGLADFWQLDSHQTDYFLYLVQFERAANPKMRAFCQRRMTELRIEQQKLQARLDYPELDSSGDTASYYSSWHLPAVHIAVSVASLKTAAQIADFLSLAEKRVEECLQLLVGLGLVALNPEGHYQLTGKFLHLPKDSPFYPIHHLTWRLRANEHLNHHPKPGFHYTSVLSLSGIDFLQVEEILKKAIEQIHQLVGDSTEEKVVGFNCDFFEL